MTVAKLVTVAAFKSMKVVAAAVYKSKTVKYDCKSFIKMASVETVRWRGRQKGGGSGVDLINLFA